MNNSNKLRKKPLENKKVNHNSPYTYREIEKIYNEIKKDIPFKPELGIILGSGLGDLLK